MTNNNCTEIAPGQALTLWQKLGLKLTSNIYGGRDVVIAIDLTESVGLNAEGRLRLTQIIEDSLHSGDTVYVVPFASEVNPLQPDVNPISFQNGIIFRGQAKDIEAILKTLPFESKIDFHNTDIQNTELFVYRELAQLNQFRLVDNQAIKPQSIVWLTDAPLSTPLGITSNIWIETPANSPFRLKNSQASQDRHSWLQALPIKERSQQITTKDNRTYQLSVVDLAPTVQEFCTPAPGGKETCLVTPYLFKMLWLPSLIMFCLAIAGGWTTKYLIGLNKKWKIKITFESDNSREQQTCYLKNQQKITIGDHSLSAIFCPGENIRGYLIRKGNQLFLKPTKVLPLYYRDRLVDKEIKINSDRLTLNCPFEGKDFEINVKLFR